MLGHRRLRRITLGGVLAIAACVVILWLVSSDGRMYAGKFYIGMGVVEARGLLSASDEPLMSMKWDETPSTHWGRQNYEAYRLYSTGDGLTLVFNHYDELIGVVPIASAPPPPPPTPVPLSEWDPEALKLTAAEITASVLAPRGREMAGTFLAWRKEHSADTWPVEILDTQDLYGDHNLYSMRIISASILWGPVVLAADPQSPLPHESMNQEPLGSAAKPDVSCERGICILNGLRWPCLRFQMPITVVGETGEGLVQLTVNLPGSYETVEAYNKRTGKSIGLPGKRSRGPRDGDGVSRGE